MAHNTTVQLGGTAFLVCKVSGVDRVGVNWVCFCLSNWAAYCIAPCHSHTHTPLCTPIVDLILFVVQCSLVSFLCMPYSVCCCAFS